MRSRRVMCHQRVWEITKKLLKKGAYITLIVRSTEKFENINFNPYKHRVSMIKCNLQDTSQIDNISKSLCYPIDGIIYSAGLGFFKSIQSHSLEEIMETYQIFVCKGHISFTEL